MSRPPDAYRLSKLLVSPWSDPVLDLTGHDPRSEYVEQFWLPVMGPSAVLLLRRLAMGLDRWPQGFECSTPELSISLGLGQRGAAGTLGRVMRRTVEFGITSMEADGRFLVRRRLPPLSPRMVQRLPGWLQAAHRPYRRVPVSADLV